MIKNWLASSAVLYVLSFLMRGVVFEGIMAALLAGLVLGFFNAILKPLLHILFFPVTIISLGLFSLVINAMVLSATAAIVPGFSINSFLTAFLAAFILSLVNIAFIKSGKNI